MTLTTLAAFAAVAVLAVAVGASAAPTPRDAAPSPRDPFALPSVDDPGWKKQDSGLEIWDVTVGNGPAVPAGGRVKVHYTGWLLDGSVFDSSKKRGEPITFGLGQVIKGWQDGIPGMKPGGVRRLKIPSDLGYGARGAGGAIPPNATLVFEVELIEGK